MMNFDAPEVKVFPKHSGKKEKMPVTINFPVSTLLLHVSLWKTNSMFVTLNFSSASAFNLDKAKILLSAERLALFNDGLTLSLLLTTLEAFVDSVDQDRTAHNVQCDL